MLQFGTRRSALLGESFRMLLLWECRCVREPDQNEKLHLYVYHWKGRSARRAAAELLRNEFVTRKKLDMGLASTANKAELKDVHGYWVGHTPDPNHHTHVLRL